MTSAIAEPDTLADVVQILGDIPIRRILWNPRPGTATEADQIRYVLTGSGRDRRDAFLRCATEAFLAAS